MKQHYCHKCQYNNLSSTACLSCSGYKQSYHSYAIDFNENMEESTEAKDEIKPASEDYELFKRTLIEIFSLSPIQLLCLQSTMNRKTLTEFAKEMTEMIKDESIRISKNQTQTFTRNRALKIKQAAISKVPYLAAAFKTALSKKDYEI